MENIKKYIVKMDYTEHQPAKIDFVVYARNSDDAEHIAKMQFLDRRSDTPTINKVEVIHSNE